jgi:hypothetical protein
MPKLGCAIPRHSRLEIEFEPLVIFRCATSFYVLLWCQQARLWAAGYQKFK